MSRDQERPEPLRDVEPAEPLAAWFGGKRYLAKRIIERIDTIPHSLYAEPFVGLGGVFLRRRRQPKMEVANDLNGEVVNLFRVVREHPDELARQFNWAVASRLEFRRLVRTPPDTLTDVQRAARFVYLQKLAFGGKPATLMTEGQMSLNRTGAEMGTNQLRRRVAAAHRRLQRVRLECLPWDAFMRRYDRPHTLFYLDPPYWGHENDYGKGMFARADFERMAAILRELQGRFILSLNDLPEVREIFAGFDFQEVTIRYSPHPKAVRRAKELLISSPSP